MPPNPRGHYPVIEDQRPAAHPHPHRYSWFIIRNVLLTLVSEGELGSVCQSAGSVCVRVCVETSHNFTNCFESVEDTGQGLDPLHGGQWTSLHHFHLHLEMTLASLRRHADRLQPLWSCCSSDGCCCGFISWLH